MLLFMLLLQALAWYAIREAWRRELGVRVGAEDGGRQGGAAAARGAAEAAATEGTAEADAGEATDAGTEGGRADGEDAADDAADGGGAEPAPQAAATDIFVSRENAAVLLASQNHASIAKLLPSTSPAPKLGTCAVVGNSGVLKLGRHGASIDRHDTVWRVNQAPVGGKEYAPIVGSRVTYRLLNSKWSTVYCEDGVYSDQVPGGTSNLARYLMGLEPPNATLVASRADVAAFDRLATAQRRRRPDLNPTALLSSRVISRARAWLLSYNDTTQEISPSTGLLAVYVAMQLCDSVSVYGFSLVDSRWAVDMKKGAKRYHYFHRFHDSEQLRAHKHHAFAFEGEFLQNLDGRGVVRLCTSRERCGVGHGAASPL